MNTKSILDSIKENIDACNWKSPTKKQRAIELCISIFNLYVNDGGNFYQYRSLSNPFFRKVIKTSSYVQEIKNNLIENSILECDHSYNVNTGTGKGYRFSNKVLDYNSDYIIIAALTQNDKKGDVALSCPNDEIDAALSCPNMQINPALCCPIENQLKRITFKSEINEWINNYKINRNDILINDDIKDDFVKIQFENGSYRYGFQNALSFAKEQNKDLIQHKDKCYVENIDEFLNRKTNEIKLIFRKVVFDIENGIYRATRNQTNNRLDYNFTNMKSDIFSFILFDGEELEELDIANSQFSILSHINKNIDEDFIELAQSGKLYRFISDAFNITEKEAKNKMFRVAFDKVKKEQDDIRSIFPKTMDFIDSYKNKYGYKSFSNLLQKVESNIMIDGLFKTLIDEGYEVFPIHDAFRVKKSESDKIKEKIEDYFNSIDFKCLLRNKKKSESKIIKYKYGNFKDVEIEITKEEIILTSNFIKEMKKEYGDICQANLIDFLNCEYKGTYLYLEYRKKYPMNNGQQHLV